MIIEQPYLTTDIPGIGGVYKKYLQDFHVEEIPLYDFCGHGEHLCFEIEKQGLSTYAALAELANALKVPRRSLGFAGLKDSQAVTRQWISLEHRKTAPLQRFRHPKMKILTVTRHTDKLKPGHLKGNRFRIRLREIKLPGARALKRAQAIMEILINRGVPNYFGPQRFGVRHETPRMGLALLRSDNESYMDLLLGYPKAEDNRWSQKARRLYEQKRYLKAYHCWPASFSLQRQALAALMRYHGDKSKACQAVDSMFKSLCISAFQSDLFNRVLARRMPLIDRLLPGDLACRHQDDTCFHVEEPDREQTRCDDFEISPTGPIWGYRMIEVSGPAGNYEHPVLAEAGIDKQDLERVDRLHTKGGRRCLRFQPRDVNLRTGKDRQGFYLQLSFELPSGCYATSLLREICKTSPS